MVLTIGNTPKRKKNKRNIIQHRLGDFELSGRIRTHELLDEKSSNKISPETSKTIHEDNEKTRTGCKYCEGFRGTGYSHCLGCGSIFALTAKD